MGEHADNDIDRALGSHLNMSFNKHLAQENKTQVTKINNMSEVKFSGTITVINETKQVSEKFSKREFVVTDNGMYPQFVIFEAIQDNCTMLDNYKVGDDVEVYYNLKGREWQSPQGETRYFNTLQAWKMESVINDESEVAGLQPDFDDLPQ